MVVAIAQPARGLGVAEANAVTHRPQVAERHRRYDPGVSLLLVALGAISVYAVLVLAAHRVLDRNR